jgi:hypothetical protein
VVAVAVPAKLLELGEPVVVELADTEVQEETAQPTLVAVAVAVQHQQPK